MAVAVASDTTAPAAAPATATAAGTDCVEITVTDSGVGIPAEHLDKIFDRFYQVDDSGSRDQEGTGIGLALAKELVELHRGEIWVESEPGTGSSFFLRLSLGKAHLKPHEIVEEEPTTDEVDQVVSEDELEEPDAGESIKTVETTDKDAPLVLIVEDNAMCASTCAAICRSTTRSSRR